ncbi:cupin domain-containing protein [Roseivivax isoporae]|nr:cupin domain-containing protein [Roseivivax isoporae]
MALRPVLLCHDDGGTLWPLARSSHPKPFAPVAGGESPFQIAVRCLCVPGSVEPIVVTPERYRFVVQDQLAQVGIAPRAILIEPAARGAAAATLVAAVHIAAQDPDAILVAMPADHVITDPHAFRAAIIDALPRAGADEIVGFDLELEEPDTGRPLPEPEPANDAGAGVVQLQRMRPRGNGDRPRASRPTHMVVCRAGALLAAVTAAVPGAVEAMRAALDAARNDLGFLRMAADSWTPLSRQALDRAMGAAASALPAILRSDTLSDARDWNEIWRMAQRDESGTATIGSATAMGCHDTLLRSDSPHVELVGIGLTDIVAIALPDAVLVVRRSEASRVPDAVAALAAMRAPQATQLPVDNRPWGFLENLSQGARFQVKRIVVKPGAALSLQSHHHRAEHWIVVAGTAQVTVDDAVSLVSENQSIYVPLGARHRLENPGKVPVTLIEVQTGSYLGEDDIVRHDDLYARD